MKILLTDVLFRKTFDVINIIKRHYPTSCLIYTIPENSLINRLKLRLIYEACDIEILGEGHSFNLDLEHISKKYNNDTIIFIPIEESTTLKFLKFMDLTKATNFRFLLPEKDAFLLSRNKKALNLFCEKHEIPCPKYIPEDIYNKREFKYPIIVKPKHGSGAKGIFYIENERELHSCSINFEKHFVQERLPNPKDVEAGFFLCFEGEIISYYGHKRIRTYPATGGVTVFSKYNKLDAIEILAKSIIKKLNWSGLIMIEFLFDVRDKKYKVIEVNPRLWGSILLSEFCGADFLKKYIELSVRGVVKPSVIEEDRYIRWIFPYDVLFWIKHMSNPIKFFKINRNTCYINFTYASVIRSFLFIILTYFNFNKIINISRNG
ncbi:ATP-grasp domain-containing protein [Ulvibacterium sp.]|uniref:ATP-grasp domain-containing protein n=1 Tax=Ulvibacterium sp. TaxID=2665914 RepID=UPI003BAB0C81